MLRTRLILIAASILVIWLIFQLPKSVVENEATIDTEQPDSIASHIETHVAVPAEVSKRIQQLRSQLVKSTQKEKNAIFADSLADLYRQSSKFDSAAWFSEEAAKFFNNADSWVQAGDDYYQAYTIAIDQGRQQAYGVKAQEFYGKVLKADPRNLQIKTKMAMTYLSTASPMQGITMLREVLAEDPNNELALFNMGMLSIQSGQHDKAVERLEQLIRINPDHVQGRLLLGIALMNTGQKEAAREQLEKVKQLDKDPAVQATVDSYLNDLK